MEKPYQFHLQTSLRLLSTLALFTILLTGGCRTVYITPEGQENYRKELLECEKRNDAAQEIIKELLDSIDQLEKCP